MKKYVVGLCASLLFLTGFICAEDSSDLITRGNCGDPFLARLVQDVLNNTNIIKPKVTKIQEITNEINSELTQCCEGINSRLDNLTVSVNNDTVLTRLDEIDTSLSQCCEELNSKLDNLNLSVNNDEVLTRLDEIDTSLSQCCEELNSKLDNLNLSVNNDEVLTRLDEIDTSLSQCCESLNSKVGDLDDSGSCLDSLIDVPTDINNLNLNVIELLKTILLELRGC